MRELEDGPLVRGNAAAQVRLDGCSSTKASARCKKGPSGRSRLLGILAAVGLGAAIVLARDADQCQRLGLAATV